MSRHRLSNPGPVPKVTTHCPTWINKKRKWNGDEIGIPLEKPFCIRSQVFSRSKFDLIRYLDKNSWIFNEDRTNLLMSIYSGIHPIKALQLKLVFYIPRNKWPKFTEDRCLNSWCQNQLVTDSDPRFNQLTIQESRSPPLASCTMQVVVSYTTSGLEKMGSYSFLQKTGPWYFLMQIAFLGCWVKWKNRHTHQRSISWIKRKLVIDDLKDIDQ